MYQFIFFSPFLLLKLSTHIIRSDRQILLILRYLFLYNSVLFILPICDRYLSTLKSGGFIRGLPHLPRRKKGVGVGVSLFSSCFCLFRLYEVLGIPSSSSCYHVSTKFNNFDEHDFSLPSRALLFSAAAAFVLSFNMLKKYFNINDTCLSDQNLLSYKIVLSGFSALMLV